jgi:toxin ParE1/3/4
MRKPVRFAREARDEILEAGRWYERQRHGLRAEFLASVDEAIERLARTGTRLELMPGIDVALGVRRLHVKRFPYTIVFIELADRIRVLAVAHNKRRPFYWRERIDR